MVCCPRCGSVIEEGADFCPGCGKVQLAPRPESGASGGDPKLGNPYAGKNEQILGLAIFVVGLIWAFGATVASQGRADYTLPVVTMLAGIVLGIVGKRRERKNNP
ncbi:MAG TPA: zinc ribbon domain-containing protein [Terriglobia bacterium]|nr:zinc ribbon domain-containing protein [Terriglobia bacterium]